MTRESYFFTSFTVLKIKLFDFVKKGSPKGRTFMILL